MQWWPDARFGMFIHWGLYALPARHEWVKHNEQIPDEVYEKYFEHFDPDLYDPQEWARRGQGGRDEVLRHHHQAPRGLLPVGLQAHRLQGDQHARTARTCSSRWSRPSAPRGCASGFYHSLIDWHHPDYHRRPATTRCATTRTSREDASEPRRPQVRRLPARPGARAAHRSSARSTSCSCDFSFPRPTDGKGRERLAEREAPEDDPRAAARASSSTTGSTSDCPAAGTSRRPSSPAARVGDGGRQARSPWEACQTFSGSWGYHRDEATWKSVQQLVVMLIDTVSKGGNLLLNVGPTGRGEFDDRAPWSAWQGMGEWMKRAQPLDLRLHAGAGRVQGAARTAG